MTNFGAKILNNAISGLNAAQAQIASAGQNIANVNTPGYSRRTVDLEVRGNGSRAGGLNIGSGVEVANIRQVVDEFINRRVQSNTSSQTSAQVQSEMLERINPLFDLTGDSTTVGTALTAFFNSMRDLESNPSSTELRGNVISKGNELVDAIKITYGTLSALQTEADDRIETELELVNGFTAQIAELNGSISRLEVGGVTANDERDKRTQLLNKLSEKIGFNLITENDGTVQVVLPSGFALVNGTTSRDLEITHSPSFDTTPTPSLAGETLGSIVYDFDTSSGTSHIDLTQILADTGGTIGGLLQFRGIGTTTATSPFEATGTVVEIASRIEAISRSLLTDVNLSYLGPDRTVGGAFVPSSGDLNGNQPATYGFFSFSYGGVYDANGNSQPDDLTAIGYTNYSSLLTVVPDDPAEVAAALDAGAFPFVGVPPAGIFEDGDGRNAQRVAEMQTTSNSYTIGSFTFTGTLDEVFNNAIVKLSSEVQSNKLASEVATSQLTAAESQRDSVSGVSLDEEFSKLIQAQRSFQASARIMRTASELLDQLLQLV